MSVPLGGPAGANIRGGRPAARGEATSTARRGGRAEDADDTRGHSAERSRGPERADTERVDAERTDEATAEDRGEERRAFAAWMAAETMPALKADKPRRVSTPDEDPVALLAELQPPAWLEAGGLTGALDAAGSGLPGVSAAPTLMGGGDAGVGGQAGGTGQSFGAGQAPPKADAEAPPMFEVEVEYEPPPATLKRPAGLKPLTSSAQAPTSAAVTAAAPNSGGSTEALGEAKPAAEAPALPREVTVREYVPMLKSVRVTIDKSLTLEMSPSDGDGVSVKLEGTADALRAMADIEGELQDELNQSGYQLDEFESEERESGESSEEGSGEAGAGDEASEAEGDVVRVVTHDGLVDAIA